jgi:TRAP-type C4-dicarboxylate transport system substrate-binding protein
MGPRSTSFLLLTAIAGVLASCGSHRSDKAGGVTTPVVLRIAAHKDNDVAQLFTDEIRRLSKGRIRVEFAAGSRDNDPADADVRHASEVRDGRYDLGVISAPAWDELGVRSLEPLQAPFLISDQSLFKAILASPLADRMLEGLRAQHVVGLSLMITWLEHIVSDFGPLSTTSDFQGKRILGPVSHVNDAVLSALGATPVHAGPGQEEKSIARGEIDGQEMPAFARPNVWLTANVTFYAPALTVVANEQRFAKLSDQQRRILRTAAAHAAQGVAREMASDPEVGLVENHCKRGHVRLASREDLAAFEQAELPVYAQLERDPQVKATIAAIRELKRRTPPDPAPRIPAGCSRAPSTTHGRARDPRFLNGTYRWRITPAGALRLGADPADDLVGRIVSITLRDGAWFSEPGADQEWGTFRVVGNRIDFKSSRHGYTDSFTFERRADGTLDLTALPPMDRSDRLIMSSSPWTLVGPPVRKGP